MRKSLLTAVSAAALISAGMVSPVVARSNSDDAKSSQVETQVAPTPKDGHSEAGTSMNSGTAGTTGTADSIDRDDPVETDAARSGEMNADTADMNEADRNTMAADSGDMATEQPEGTYLASELTGEPVQNGAGEDLAEIEDFVIGEDGTIGHVIVSFGGFLGLGDKEVMLPWNQFQIMTDPEDEDDMIARLDMTEEEIEALPEFKSREEIRDDEDVERTEPATTGTGTTGTTGTTGATN